jgi:hypothetical protein
LSLNFLRSYLIGWGVLYVFHFVLSGVRLGVSHYLRFSRGGMEVSFEMAFRLPPLLNLR